MLEYICESGRVSVRVCLYLSMCEKARELASVYEVNLGVTHFVLNVESARKTFFTSSHT